MDDEPMWAADRVVALNPGSAITIPETANEFAIKGNEREVGYGITNTWDEMLEDMPGAPATDETELGRRMTNFVNTIRQDTYEIYVRLGEAHDEVIDDWSAQLTTER
ncbi:hypothetical protein Tco_0668159 [Tanacetum coccineum]